MASYIVKLPENYASILKEVNYKISSYPKYVNVANELKKHNISEGIIAGLIGCICPESGCESDRIMGQEFYQLPFNKEGTKKPNPGTHHWNCGEGLVQWTFWDSKIKHIREYNNDSRSTQKLPTTEEEYFKGEPLKDGNRYYAPQDGKHIAGLTLENQIIFLLLYYDSIIKSLANETNLAVITAKIYQKKAGQGFFQEESDPIVQAFKTAARHYKQGESQTGNTYLRSLSIAQQYLNNPPVATTPAVSDYYNSGGSVYSGGYSYSAGGSTYSGRYFNNVSETTNVTGIKNNVMKLSSSSKYYKNQFLKQNDNRKKEFESLQTSMTEGSLDMGMDIYLSQELYDSNILKGSQESKMVT